MRISKIVEKNIGQRCRAGGPSHAQANSEFNSTTMQSLHVYNKRLFSRNCSRPKVSCTSALDTIEKVAPSYMKSRAIHKLYTYVTTCNKNLKALNNFSWENFIYENKKKWIEKRERKCECCFIVVELGMKFSIDTKGLEIWHTILGVLNQLKCLETFIWHVCIEWIQLWTRIEWFTHLHVAVNINL